MKGCDTALQLCNQIYEKIFDLYLVLIFSYMRDYVESNMMNPFPLYTYLVAEST